MTSSSGRRAGVVQGSEPTATLVPSPAPASALLSISANRNLRCAVTSNLAHCRPRCPAPGSCQARAAVEIDRAAQDSELLVSELVTNAVKATADAPRRPSACEGGLVRAAGSIARAARSGEGREPPFVRTNRPADSMPRTVPPAPSAEGDVGDAAGAVHGLDLEALFERLQPIPQPLPAAQHDGHHDDVQVVDQVGGQELADGGRAAANTDIRPPAAWRACASAWAGPA